MKSRPTIKDVARLANVSLGTASRVLNGRADVAPALRERVEHAISSLGYVPDTTAQTMRSGATRMVGVMVRNIIIPSLAGFVRGVEDELFAAGYVPLIACSDDRKDRELALLSLFSHRRMDGIIMLSASDVDPELVAARAGLAAPLVLFDRAAPLDRDAVLVAHREGMIEAVRHLYDLGHRRIALLTGSSDVFPAAERVRGYTEALAAAGIPADPELLVTRSFEDAAGEAELREMLGKLNRPTAVIVGGIAMLPGALRSIRAAGLAVPYDLSLIAATDSDLAALSQPPVTVVDWDYMAMGRTAARLLLERIAEPGLPPRQRVFATRLIKRGTCASPN